MKILFVTDLFPIGNENITKALFDFVSEWKNQGHEIDIIRANFILNSLIRKRKIIKEKLYKQNGINIFNLNFNTPFLFDVYKKLPKNFSLKNYDVIISHMPCGALMAQALLKKDKIKYICACHCSDIQVLTDIKYSFYFKNQLKKSYMQADKIAARSPVLKNKIEQIIPEVKNKTFVAYSGINQEIITKSLNKKLTATTIASFIKRKNINIIINAVKNLPEIQLNIIGSGEEEKKLKFLAKGHPNITFLGQMTHSKVIEKLTESDIFILLSDNETFGLCYLEAMATRNIIIAKKNDGIDGILHNDENSFLINANSDELEICLRNLISRDKTKLIEIKNNCYTTIKDLTLYNAAQHYLFEINK